MKMGFKLKGDFRNTEKFLQGAADLNLKPILEKYGRVGVDALRRATPIDSGVTADSWVYEVGGNKRHYWISWGNTHVHKGVQVAVILYYGHGTGTGGFVQGREYINPAMKSVFDQIAKDVWKEVIKL